jgi:hypothetical protein
LPGSNVAVIAKRLEGDQAGHGDGSSLFGAGDVRQAAHDRPVTRVDLCRPNASQYLAVPDLGLVDVPEFQHLG